MNRSRNRAFGLAAAVALVAVAPAAAQTSNLGSLTPSPARGPLATARPTTSGTTAGPSTQFQGLGQLTTGGQMTSAGSSGTTGQAGQGQLTGPWADIADLADMLSQEFGLQFTDPEDEMLFFMLVAQLYFEMNGAGQSGHHQWGHGTTTSSGASQNGQSGTTSTSSSSGTTPTTGR